MTHGPRTQGSTRRPPGAGARRGFTLLENLMAAVVLGIVVLAVGLAASSAQKAAFEGQKMVLASMAADDLMSELQAVNYTALPTYDGLNQPVGAIATLAGDTYPSTYWPIGRRVSITDTQYQEPGLGAKVNGRSIVITIFDDSRDVTSLDAFVPEPAP